MKLEFKTPAKINLGLNLLGKRSDGYHELETLFQMVGLCDDLVLESATDRVTLEVVAEDKSIPADESNLVLRAARAMQELFPEKTGLGARIRLQKRIPAGGGLGGGSGNAAATLLGLNILWNLNLSRQKLIDLAAGLGSDVPFFLVGPSAIGRGRGERLEVLQPPKKFTVMLIAPRFSIATGEVYSQVKLELTKKQNNFNILQQFFSQSDVAGIGANVHNDLEVVVLQKYPVIRRIKDEAEAQGASGALVSGSGSTVFAIFDSPEAGKKALTHWNKGDWDLFLTETVTSLSELYPEEVLKAW